MKNGTFTSESVGEGHPDKVADLISDTVLDAALAQDPGSRVACEALVKDGTAVVAGEITLDGELDIDAAVREAVREAGYRTAEDDDVFNAERLVVRTLLCPQSPDIARGVDGEAQGAGDQGIMFGYASDETPELMPAPIMFAHRIMMELARVRHEGGTPWLRPDSKSQVSVEYRDGAPVRIVNAVVSTQHSDDVDNATIREFCKEIILRVLPAELVTPETQFFINPTGRFVVGGPHGDCGLTGRKIIVDTYGSMGRHGGGAFSGKDASKVDRSGAYAARWAAKHVVAAGLARCCELQLAYAIGVAEPVGVLVETFGTENADPEAIARRVREAFDFRPASIVAALGLKRPIFRKSTNYGHFGREGLPWEELDQSRLDFLKG